MKVYDISLPIRPGVIIYEGNPAVRLERADSIARGAHANVGRLELGVYAGTYVDAPSHFIEGAPGSESLELEVLIGPAALVDATTAEGDLDQRALARLDIPEGTERVLLKTQNGRPWARLSATSALSAPTAPPRAQYSFRIAPTSAVSDVFNVGSVSVFLTDNFIGSTRGLRGCHFGSPRVTSSPEDSAQRSA
jgi:kynurenine formamidase